MDRALHFRPAQRLCPLATLLAAGLQAQAPPQPAPPQGPPVQTPPGPPSPVPGAQPGSPAPGQPPQAVAAPPAQAPQGPPDLQSKNYSFAAEDIPIPIEKVPGQVRIFVLDDIRRSGARNLGEFLAGEMPAEYAQQGGPGLPTQAFQGGARPVDTVITMDGVRVNDPGQVGTDLTQIPIVGIARVEVITGPQSARLGSGAQGGIIALFSGGAPDTAGGTGEMAARGGSSGQGGGRALPNFRWGQGYLRAGNASGQQGQSTDTAQPFRYSSTFLNLGQRFGGFGFNLDYRNTYQGVPDPYEDATVLNRVYDPNRQDSQRVTTSRVGLSWALGPIASLDVTLNHAQFDHRAAPQGSSLDQDSSGRNNGLGVGLSFGLGIARLGFSLDGSEDRVTQPGAIAGQDEAKARHGALGSEFSVGLGSHARFVINGRYGRDDQDLDLSRGISESHRQYNGSFRGAFEAQLGYGFRAYLGGGKGYNTPLLGQALLNANNGGAPLKNETNNFSLLGVLFGKGSFYSRVEGTRSVVQNVIAFNGTAYANSGSIRVQGVETSVGFKIGRLWGMESFVRAQESRNLDAAPGQQYTSLSVSGRPFNSHGMKIFAGGGVWHLDLHYTLVGHRYEWIGDYTCNGLVPNVVATDVVYRDLSAVGSLALGKHVTVYFRGEHLLQPKIDPQQWVNKVPDNANDASRVYGIPAPAATSSLEVVYRY